MHRLTAAAAAAAARYPQAISLDDPMVAATISPRLFGSHEMEGGYRVEASQKYPWPGKLSLRGQYAASEARAAGHDVNDTRLQLIESAYNAFADYYLAERGLDVNRESLRLLRAFRNNAETLYKTGKVQQQDLLQADVEIGQQRQRQLTLTAHAPCGAGPHQYSIASTPGKPRAAVAWGSSDARDAAGRDHIASRRLSPPAGPAGDGRSYRG